MAFLSVEPFSVAVSVVEVVPVPTVSTTVVVLLLELVAPVTDEPPVISFPRSVVEPLPVPVSCVLIFSVSFAVFVSVESTVVLLLSVSVRL